MTRIESDIEEINNTEEKVYRFLSNLDNLEKLMPEQVVNWKSTQDTCSFTIKGMTELSMKIAEKIPYSKIIIVPDGKSTFDFSLILQFDSQKENLTIAQIIFQAELNSMMEMLARNPLQNFVNILVRKLKELGNNL